jgi:hypothetical protein
MRTHTSKVKSEAVELKSSVLVKKSPGACGCLRSIPHNILHDTWSFSTV